jgi:hypothetical protein
VRKSRRHLPVQRTSVVRAPIAPRRGSAVLRRHQIEDLGGGRDAETRTLEQQASSVRQALADVAATVEVGVVDQPFPAEARPRFLEVDAHHDEKRVGNTRCEFAQTPRIVER